MDFSHHARTLSCLSCLSCLFVLTLAACSGDDKGGASSESSAASTSTSSDSESDGSSAGSSASTSATASTDPTSGGSQTGGSGSTSSATSSGTADTDTPGSSGGTGAVSCDDATDEVSFFLNKNQPCVEDRDCVMVDASCWPETQDCCVLYVNGTYDAPTWAFLYEQYQTACGVRECGCCAKVPFEPACVDGQCGPSQG